MSELRTEVNALRKKVEELETGTVPGARNKRQRSATSDERVEQSASAPTAASSATAATSTSAVGQFALPPPALPVGQATGDPNEMAIDAPSSAESVCLN